MKNMGLRSIQNQAGMTLLEIMVVLGIIGTLMAIVGTQVNTQLQKSRVDNAKILLVEVGKALDSYNKDCGSYPTTDQGLAALAKSTGEACPNWGPTPYLKKIPKDPWNGELIYESNGGSYTLKSLGRDRKENGEGYDKDIVSSDL